MLLHSTVALKFDWSSLIIYLYSDLIKILCCIDCKLRPWAQWENEDGILSHTLTHLNVKILHWWGHEKILLFPISFSLSIILPPFFLTIPLSLAVLTCLLNRRHKSFSKALALVFKWVEGETHSHCHIFSSSLHYSMCFVLFFFQRDSFPQPLHSVSWPLRKELCKSKQLFSSCSLSCLVFEGWLCFILISPV